MTTRPAFNEYDSYFAKYIDLVPEGDIVETLKTENNETIRLLNGLSEMQGLFRYAPDKWSMKEIIGHLLDSERILSSTLFWIARGEAISLPGYDKNAFIQKAVFDCQPNNDLIRHWAIARQSSVELIKSLNPDDWSNSGTANNSPVTVRALAFILAGHELHHRKAMKERYMNAENYPLE